MSYTGDSLIHSTGKASAATIDAWMARKGQQLAPGYAPDKTYRQPPPIGEAIVRLSKAVEVNSDFVAAQICKESAGWQSQIVRDKNNPSGLGAVNNNPYGGAVTFDTPEAGIQATIAHLLTYTLGTSNPWWDLDPRATAVPQKNLGVVDTLSDLDGKWAWPGDGYGAGIAALANDLAASEPEQEPVMSLIQTLGQRIAAHGIKVHDIRDRMPTNGSYSRYSGPYPTHTAVHYTGVSRQPASLEAEINSWVGHGRYHVQSQGWPGIAYTIGISLSGRVFLLGEAELWRYHIFNDNPRAFPVSHDMTLGQQPTPAMLKSLQAVLTVLHEETPEFPNLVRANTYGHQEFGRIPGGDSRNASTSCPGALLPYVQQYRAGAPIVAAPEPPECLTFAEVPYRICHGFRAFWEKYGGLPIFGLPLSDEMQENGMTVQYFERARFEHQPGSNADAFDVVLGRIGAELLETRNPE